MRTPRNSLKVDSGETLVELAAKHKLGYETIRYRYHLGIRMPELVAPGNDEDRASRVAAELKGKVVYRCLPCRICGSTRKYVLRQNCVDRKKHPAIRQAAIFSKSSLAFS